MMQTCAPRDVTPLRTPLRLEPPQPAPLDRPELPAHWQRAAAKPGARLRVRKIVAGQLQLRELGRGAGHGHGAACDRRLRAHALAGRDGLLEQAVEVAPKTGRRLPDLVHLPDLRQDLPLAHHQRVQAAGHPAAHAGPPLSARACTCRRALLSCLQSQPASGCPQPVGAPLVLLSTPSSAAHRLSGNSDAGCHQSERPQHTSVWPQPPFAPHAARGLYSTLSAARGSAYRRAPQQVARGILVAEQEHVRAQLLKRDPAGPRHPLLHLPHPPHTPRKLVEHTAVPAQATQRKA